MTEYHVAIDHPESPDPDSPVAITTTYLGTVDQAHVDQVRAIAALDDAPRHVLEHPRISGAFMVLREDGDLDVYVPVGAREIQVVDSDTIPVHQIDTDGSGTGESLGPVTDRRGKTVGEMRDTGRRLKVSQVEPDMPRGATAGPAYISGVTRFGDQSIGGAMDYPGNPPRAVWHTTESPAGGNYFNSIAAYLIRVGSEPQVIYCPVTDRLGQFGPLTQSARALKNDGSRRTNREGKVCIQVEVLGRAASPWTNGFDPATKPNYRKLIAAMRAHGIPDTWPAGKLPATYAAATKGARSRSTWQGKGGHYGHAQIPGNDHWDPGAIDTSIVPGKPDGDTNSSEPAQPAEPAKPVDTDKDAFPGASQFGPGANNAYVTRLGQMLVQRGGKRFYTEGPGPKWGDADRNATRAFQRAQGWGGSDADGIPGATTWRYLVEGKGKDIPPPAPQFEPFPGAAFFHGGRYSAVITAMGRRLVAEGCGRYQSGPGPNWTNADRASYAAWQRKLGLAGSEADGIPGKASWDKLRVPKV